MLDGGGLPPDLQAPPAENLQAAWTLAALIALAASGPGTEDAGKLPGGRYHDGFC
jgi:hypothetical protein